MRGMEERSAREAKEAAAAAVAADSDSDCDMPAPASPAKPAVSSRVSFAPRADKHVVSDEEKAADVGNMFAFQTRPSDYQPAKSHRERKKKLRAKERKQNRLTR